MAKQKTATKVKYEVDIEALKKEHGIIYELTAADDKSCLIKDPLSDMKVVKLYSFHAQNGDDVAFAQSILSNCFLAGDEEMIKNEDYASGLLDDLNTLTDAPDAEITRVGNHLMVICEGFELPVKSARREQLILAKKANPKRKLWETQIKFLDLVCLDKNKLEDLKKDNRLYIGVLQAMDELIEKIDVSVKKL